MQQDTRRFGSRRLLAWLGVGLSVLGFAACQGEMPSPEACDAPLSVGEQEGRWPEGEAGTMARKLFAMACGAGTKQIPDPRNFTTAVDGYASYASQSTCNPSAKPGVVAFRDMVLATYPCTGDYGIVRSCNVGGTSEHKEGRAWDWKVNYPHPAADALLNWLLATDSKAVPHAMARRLGIMYMIWNKQIWRPYRSPPGWGAYTGSNPHTDHVHFSFSWAGANKQTTYWQAPTTPPDPSGCTAQQRTDCGAVGCACVDGKCSGGFCDGSGCTSKQTSDCAAFGCGCVDGKCSGGACPESGCTAKQTSDCSKFGCGCADGKCSGGTCPGSGCTYKQTDDCGKYGCNCADGGCSGGFCPNGTGCTFKETQDCQAKGCGCVDHVCAGGSCQGSGCTPGKVQDCQKQGCGCAMMECREGSCCDGKAEVCDGRDNDCDGKVDEGDPEGGKACQAPGGGVGKTVCQQGKIVCLLQAPSEGVVERPSEVAQEKVAEIPKEGAVSSEATGEGPIERRDEDLETDGGPTAEIVYPEFASFCEAVSGRCSEGVLRLDPLKLGDKGCQEMGDCKTNLCVRRDGEARCSLACGGAVDCPQNFTCTEQKVCWPTPEASTKDVRVCQDATQCEISERCERGYCLGGLTPRPVGSGCSCSSAGDRQEPFLPMLPLLSLLLLWGLRRHRPKIRRACFLFTLAAFHKSFREARTIQEVEKEIQTKELQPKALPRAAKRKVRRSAEPRKAPQHRCPTSSKERLSTCPPLSRKCVI